MIIVRGHWPTQITVSDMKLDRTKLNQKTIAKKSIVENKETADSKFV